MPIWQFTISTNDNFVVVASVIFNKRDFCEVVFDHDGVGRPFIPRHTSSHYDERHPSGYCKGQRLSRWTSFFLSDCTIASISTAASSTDCRLGRLLPLVAFSVLSLQISFGKFARPAIDHVIVVAPAILHKSDFGEIKLN